MVSYVYKNGKKTKNFLKDKLKKIFELEILSESSENLMLGNEDILFYINENHTDILLMDENTNLNEVRKLFRG